METAVDMRYGSTLDQPEDDSSELGLPWSVAYSDYCYVLPFQEKQLFAELKRHLHREISAKPIQNILCEPVNSLCSIANR